MKDAIAPLRTVLLHTGPVLQTAPCCPRDHSTPFFPLTHTYWLLWWSPVVSALSPLPILWGNSICFPLERYPSYLNINLSAMAVPHVGQWDLWSQKSEFSDTRKGKSLNRIHPNCGARVAWRSDENPKHFQKPENHGSYHHDAFCRWSLPAPWYTVIVSKSNAWIFLPFCKLTHLRLINSCSPR